MSYLATSLLLLFVGCNRPEPAEEPPVVEQQTKQQYENPAQFVASMTKYYVGVLSKGPNFSEEKITERIQATSENWKKAVAEGKLVGAVRVAEPVDLWGLLFFKTESMDEMKAIADNSVLVKEGLLSGEVIKVWGTRGLGAGLAATMKDDPDAKMKQETYYMAIYRKGENWSEKSDDPSTRETTAEGMQYLFDMYNAGALRYYAAVEDMSRPARGMAILSAGSIEEAKVLAQKGPMVEKKWLTVDVTPVHIIGGVLP
jgi:hypothetical protein